MISISEDLFDSYTRYLNHAYGMDGGLRAWMRHKWKMAYGFQVQGEWS